MYHSQSKKVPQSLKECYAPSYIAENLYEWADRLEHWGRTLFVVLIVIGIIGAIGGAVASGDLWFLTLLGSLAVCFISALLEYLIYNAIALLISALASIVENTKISADVALYKAAKDEEYSEEAAKIPQTQKTPATNNLSVAERMARTSSPSTPGARKCSNCGKENPAYIVRCSCGTPKC